MEERSHKTGESELRRAVLFALPFRFAILVVLLLTISVGLFNALEPMVLKYVFDRLEGAEAMKALLNGCLLLVGMAIAREGASAVSNWLTWRTRLRMHSNLLEKMVERMHRMPLSLLRKEGVGGLITRVDRSIQGFLNGIGQLLFSAIPSVVYLSVSVYLMFRMEPRLALLVILFTPLPLMASAWVSSAQARRERLILRTWVRIYSRFNEVLSGILTVRSFAMEEAEKNRFLRNVRKANDMVVRSVAADSTTAAVSNLITLLARVAAIAYGGILLIRHETTIGTLVAFLGYLGGLFGPVLSLGGIYQGIRKASVSMQDIFGILDMKDYMVDAPDAKEVTDVSGQIIFENVYFTYGDRQILNGIHFHVVPGQTVAIVGPSGAGKTTLMALLQRFYDPVSGTISLDGRDLRTLKQESLRRRIGVVLQDPVLFNDTVRNNIQYGKPNSTMQEIRRAAEAARAADFIEALPEGYSTMLGERAARLSTGERQRITIARALIKDPAVVILDEATSALDTESELFVQEAISHLIHGRTTFIIAHRLSTVVNADLILVMKEGKILEQGSHATLMSQGGYYSWLVERQLRGFLPEDTPLT